MASSGCSSLESDEGSPERKPNTAPGIRNLEENRDEDPSEYFESFKVSILHHCGPGTIYVQRSEQEVVTFHMANDMEDYFNKMEVGGVLDPSPLPSLRPGALLALRQSHRGGVDWHRVKLLSLELPQISVTLIDRGGTCVVPHDAVYPLPRHLRSSKPLAIRCHLFCLQPAQQVDGASDRMEALMKAADSIVLRRRGAGCLTEQGEVSFPCDLSLIRANIPDPFEPQVDIDESLIQLLRLTGFGDDGTEHPGSDELAADDCDQEDDPDKTQEESIEEDSEFSHVEPMKQNPDFKWLPPELPSERTFGVRGTYVDSAGQVYFQLDSQREVLRTLRRLLKEKFAYSKQDCPPDAFVKNQEVIVKWKDDEWARARFLQYRGNNWRTGKAIVVLVDFGNMFEIKVTEIRATIYGERLPVLAHRAVIHNLVPAGSECWKDEFLDYLNDEIHYAQQGFNNVMVARVVGKPRGSYPLSISLESRQICDKCKRKGVRSVRTCTDFMAFDLAELVTNPPAEWVGLKTFGAVMGRDLAALRHPGLTHIREQFDLIQPVESGTYNRPIDASLLIAPSDLLHLKAPQVCLATPLDLSSFIQPGERLAVMQTTMIKQFNKVVIQPWAEPDTVLGQVVQTFLEKVEGPNTEMQEVCKRNPPVLRPRPGLLCVARSGEGVNRRWCRAKVVACSEEHVTVEFLDWGDEETIFDSQKLHEMPEEWEGLPAMAVEVELELELEDSKKLNDPDLLTFLMDEAIQTFNSRGRHSWVSVSRIEGLGKLAGQIVCDEGGPIYQGLVKEGIVKLIT